MAARTHEFKDALLEATYRVVEKATDIGMPPRCRGFPESQGV
jgi:hypothetical protein